MRFNSTTPRRHYSTNPLSPGACMGERRPCHENSGATGALGLRLPVLLRPIALAFLLDLIGHGIGFDPLGGLVQHAEELHEVLGVQEDADLADLVAVLLALSLIH